MPEDCQSVFSITGFQDQPSIASRRLEITFDVQNQILILTNLYLDKNEGMSEQILYICTWSASRISLQTFAKAQLRGRGQKSFNFHRISFLFIPLLKYLERAKFQIQSLDILICQAKIPYISRLKLSERQLNSFQPERNISVKTVQKFLNLY